MTAGIHWLGTALLLVATAYVCAAFFAVLKSRRDAISARVANDSRHLRPASVLKPLCGAEPRLYENLRSFCIQAYPDYELVFGMRDQDDPAAAVARRLLAEFPHLSITLVTDPRVHGANPKIGNLINMLPHARHDWLVLADSDISVPADYLARVAAPLADSNVGIVTCLYRGVARMGLWSRLGRLFIDDWFAPSVRLAHALGSTAFAFGSTIAVRREVLASVGGFEALRDTLADDFWLGELTRRKSLRTVLSDLVVDTEVGETGFPALWTREVRWLRTIRSIAPVRFAMTFICFTTPVALAGLALAPGLLNACLTVASLGVRILLNFSSQDSRCKASSWRDVLLIPARDTLLLLEWAIAMAGWRVKWRGNVLHGRGKGASPGR